VIYLYWFCYGHEYTSSTYHFAYMC